MTKPRIALIIGSTRETRFADKPAAWLLEKAQARTDIDVELVDLRDYDLPLFNEVASNMWAPSQDPNVLKWQKKIAEFDGYIFLVAEYNHSITGALKKGDEVRLVGFGTFSVSKRKASTGRNPRTGAAVEVKAKNVPYFKPGKEMRERLNS